MYILWYFEDFELLMKQNAQYLTYPLLFGMAFLTCLLVIFFLRNSPDQAAGHGLSLNFFLAFGLSMFACFYTAVSVLLFGKYGYLLLAITYPIAIYKIKGKLKNGEGGVSG